MKVSEFNHRGRKVKWNMKIIYDLVCLLILATRIRKLKFLCENVAVVRWKLNWFMMLRSRKLRLVRKFSRIRESTNLRAFSISHVIDYDSKKQSALNWTFFLISWMGNEKSQKKLELRSADTLVTSHIAN